MAPTRQQTVQELGRAVQRYQRSAQSFDDAVGRRLSLGPADLRCLDWLVEGPFTAGDLARASGLRPAATTTLIDRLASRGLIERVRPEDDRRKVMVRLTEEGARLMWASYGPMVDEANRMLSRFTIAEMDTIRRFLDSSRHLTDRQRELIEE